jgi:hypothetical protein
VQRTYRLGWFAVASRATCGVVADAVLKARRNGAFVGLRIR